MKKIALLALFLGISVGAAALVSSCGSTTADKVTIKGATE